MFHWFRNIQLNALMATAYGVATAICVAGMLQARPARAERFEGMSDGRNFTIALNLPPGTHGKVNNYKSEHMSIKIEFIDNQYDSDMQYIYLDTSLYFLSGGKNESCEKIMIGIKKYYKLNERENNLKSNEYELISEFSSFLECNLTVFRNSDEAYASLHYIWAPNCICFLHFYSSYRADGEILRKYLDQGILPNLRRENDLPPKNEAALRRVAQLLLPDGAPDLDLLESELFVASTRNSGEGKININDIRNLFYRKKIELYKISENEILNSNDNDDVKSHDMKEPSELLTKMKELLEMDEKNSSNPKRNTSADRTPPRNPNGITFIIENDAGGIAHLKFFNTGLSNSFPAKGVWPASNQAYVLNYTKTETYNLACKKGEHICFGAEFAAGGRTYWGAALSGRESCEACCGICGSGQHSIRLRYNGSSPSAPSVSSNGGNGAEILGSVLGAVGGVLANQPTQRSPQSPPALPRGPSHRPSGISR